MRALRLLPVRAAAVLLALSAGVLALEGTGEAGVRAWIRLTARTSLVLFLLAFVARPLHQLWRHRASAWLLANRRGLGLSFAVSHGLHGLGLLWFGLAHPVAYRAQVGPSTLWGGLVGFAFVAALAATSNDASVRRLGRRRWRRLHRTGIWVLFAIFLLTFGGAAAGTGAPLHVAASGLLLAALGLRAGAWLRSPRRRPPAAAPDGG